MAAADDDKRPLRREPQSSSIASSEGQVTPIHPLSAQSSLLPAAVKVRS
jgi:hypothetical protein